MDITRKQEPKTIVNQEDNYLKRIALLIEYDGTNYAGWQIQNHKPSIQGEINKALSAIADTPIRITGSGRTDAGVHASGQVAHCDIPSSLFITEEKFPLAINTRLPKDIRIRKVCQVSSDFHARFQPIARSYRYRLRTEPSVFDRHFAWSLRWPLNPNLLSEPIRLFRGKRNFTSFSKHNIDTKNYFCTVENAYWEQVSDIEWNFYITADKFVYGMVRSIVGACIDFARNKISLSDIEKKFEQPTRNQYGFHAPACGLTLEKVTYPQPIFG